MKSSKFDTRWKQLLRDTIIGSLLGAMLILAFTFVTGLINYLGPLGGLVTFVILAIPAIYLLVALLGSMKRKSPMWYWSMGWNIIAISALWVFPQMFNWIYAVAMTANVLNSAYQYMKIVNNPTPEEEPEEPEPEITDGEVYKMFSQQEIGNHINMDFSENRIDWLLWLCVLFAAFLAWSYLLITGAFAVIEWPVYWIWIADAVLSSIAVNLLMALAKVWFSKRQYTWMASALWNGIAVVVVVLHYNWPDLVSRMWNLVALSAAIALNVIFAGYKLYRATYHPNIQEAEQNALNHFKLKLSMARRSNNNK